MTVQVFENGVLIWYDTANQLDGVLRRAANLASFHQDHAIHLLAADAQKIRAEINNAIAEKASVFTGKRGV